MSAEFVNIHYFRQAAFKELGGSENFPEEILLKVIWSAAWV